MNFKDLENKLGEERIKKLIEESKDNKSLKYKYKDKGKIRRLEKKADKKPDHVLVMYFTQKYTIRHLLCKVLGGNIIVVDNKVHLINPRFVWRRGKSVWYCIREIDRLPISNVDYDKLIEQKRITVNDAPVIKAILGAVQKKEVSAEAKKWIIWIVIGIVVVVGAYLLFGRT